MNGKRIKRNKTVTRATSSGRIIIISEPDAILRVELIQLSGEERRSLTTNVRIPDSVQNDVSEPSTASD